MTDHITNEDLASQLETIRLQVARASEDVAAIVHQAIKDHTELIPHSGVTIEEAKRRIAQIEKLAETSKKLIELLEGRVALDLHGNPKIVEPGIVQKIEKILAQTNGGMKVKFTTPAWVTLVGALIASVIAALRNLEP
jgi:hypothetical protein